ncbi:MAG: hypothetical protein HYZ50_22815 [Deltaproteobacteria bacterium]|nr:hypothetical protein [Deltaproteobacteria bacterium]
MQTIMLEVQDKATTIPLLEAALQKQAAQVALGIGKTRKRLGEFERKYGCRLEEVDLTAPQIDPLDRVEWEGEAEMLQRLETEQAILKAVRVCA